MKRIIFYISFGIIFGALFIFLFSEDVLMKKEGRVVLAGEEFMLEIADSQRERYQGLSERENICQKCGMIFYFPEKGKHVFVMRNMNFDLDIIWLKDNKIVEIEKNISRLNPDPLGGKVESDKVIEVNSGTCDRLGLEVGNVVRF